MGFFKRFRRKTADKESEGFSPDDIDFLLNASTELPEEGTGASGDASARMPAEMSKDIDAILGAANSSQPPARPASDPAIATGDAIPVASAEIGPNADVSAADLANQAEALRRAIAQKARRPRAAA